MLNLIGFGAVAGLIPSIWELLQPCCSEGYCHALGRLALIGVATGVLVYLFFDLMHEAVELTGVRDVLSWGVFLASLGISLVGLVALESSQILGGRPASRLLSLPYMIAIGMGFHNLGEGLAIGASYANGEWALSMLLVTGFGLHNGTEGFGIVGAAGKTPVKWMDVFLLGLLAGAPTCVGTLLSGQGLSPYVSISFTHWQPVLSSMSSSPSRRSPTRRLGVSKWLSVSSAVSA